MDLIKLSKLLTSYFTTVAAQLSPKSLTTNWLQKRFESKDMSIYGPVTIILQNDQKTKSLSPFLYHFLV